MLFITLPDHDEEPLFCLFCGRKILDANDERALSPCEHVLSVFHIEGVEHCSDRAPAIDRNGAVDMLDGWKQMELSGALGLQLGQSVDTRLYVVLAP